jgi:hypothetical protein
VSDTDVFITAVLSGELQPMPTLPLGVTVSGGTSSDSLHVARLTADLESMTTVRALLAGTPWNEVIVHSTEANAELWTKGRLDRHVQVCGHAAAPTAEARPAMVLAA